VNWAAISVFFSGLLFSLGICLSGMAQPAKVTGFLDFIGDWDPSLAMVMAGAVSTYYVLQRLIMNRPAPALGGSFALPTKRDIDGRLIAGAALFGIGWGLVGFCPGPALIALITLNEAVWIFVISMSLGMYVFGSLDARYADEPDSGAGYMEIVREVEQLKQSIRQAA
jgi:uncharacterized membrane protein YedE/YeeE